MWSMMSAEQMFRKVWNDIKFSFLLSWAVNIHILNVTYFNANLLTKYTTCI